MILISTILNILFEVWFITYFMIKLKSINKNKIELYIITLVAYLLSSILCGFLYKNQIYMLISYAFIEFLIMRGTNKYKTVIFDIFMVFYALCILSYSTIIFTLIFKYNLISLIFNRIFLIILILLNKDRIHKLYELYKINWNRKKGNRIKSITLRNISIIVMNLTIFALNYYLLNYLLNIIN